MKKITEYSVGELMQKNISFVKETTPVVEAIRMMDSKKLSSLLVELEHPLDAHGIITRKDIVIEAAENWENLSTLKVFDLATKPVIAIQASVGIKHAVRLMRLAGVRRLGVYEGDKLVGIISNEDIFREVQKWARPAS